MNREKYAWKIEYNPCAEQGKQFQLRELYYHDEQRRLHADILYPFVATERPIQHYWNEEQCVGHCLDLKKWG